MGDMFVIVEWHRGNLAGTPSTPYCPGEIFDDIEDAQRAIDELIHAAELEDDETSVVVQYATYRLVEEFSASLGVTVKDEDQ